MASSPWSNHGKFYVFVKKLTRGIHPVSVYFYTNGMNILNLLMIVELLCKILFILVLFNYFKEVSAILGWLFGLLITIYFYRKNSKGIFIDAKS